MKKLATYCLTAVASPNGRISLFNLLAAMAFLSIIGFSAGMGYLYLFDGRTPIEIFNSPVPTDKAVYRPGETVSLVLDFCLSSTKPATVYAVLIDGFIKEMPPISVGSVDVGCYEGKQFGIKLPDSVEPADEVYLQLTHVYQVNPIRERHVSYSSQTFEIVPKEEEVSGTFDTP